MFSPVKFLVKNWSIRCLIFGVLLIVSVGLIVLPILTQIALLLSGTPLNEALITLHQILPKFQKENKLQKVQCIVLTDGEANQLVHHKEVQRRWDKEPIIGTGYINPTSTFIRDRKLGTTYKIGYGYHEFTDTLLRNLKDKFSSTNFIGIRVLEGRNASRFIQLYHSHNDDKVV
jgi:hypothetical protein